MERKKFLEMCRRVSMMSNGVSGIKKNVPLDMRVEHGGIWYYPVGYKLFFDNDGMTQHTAILHDLQRSTIIECKLNEVKEFIEL